MTKKGKITHYAVAVQLKDGKTITSPWLKTLPQARTHVKKKLKLRGRKARVDAVYKFVLRKGMSPKDVERTKIRKL